MRYNELPTRFLARRSSADRAFWRRSAEAGLLYFRPGRGAAAGIQVLDGYEERPEAGWLQVTTGEEPEVAEAAWQAAQ